MSEITHASFFNGRCSKSPVEADQSRKMIVNVGPPISAVSVSAMGFYGRIGDLLDPVSSPVVNSSVLQLAF